MADVVKDSAYFLAKLQASVKSRIPAVVFRLWDPLSTWLDATGKRAAEIVAAILQTANDFYIDSAAGTKLDRRLGNEGCPRIQPTPANDGTITLVRQTASPVTYTFNPGDIQVQPQPDPSNPTATQPTFVNTTAVTIGPSDGTSWTVTFKATSGGANTNLAAGTTVLLVTQATYFDTASVGTAFTTGSDGEPYTVDGDNAYRRRGKLFIRSRAKGTLDALVLAAIAGGASFVFTTEDFTGNGNYPVTLYCADAAGALSAGLSAAIALQVNGQQNPNDPANPIVPMSRAYGIYVSIVAASTVTTNFRFVLTLQSWVVDTPGSLLLTDLRSDITTAVQAYIASLNDPGCADRTIRVNRLKDIVMSFGARGVMDITDADFTPAANVALTASEMALAGTFTWV